MSERIYKIGDEIIVTKSSYHCSNHIGMNDDPTSKYYNGIDLIERNKKYLIEEVDTSFQYFNGYAIKINGHWYGSTGIKLLSSDQDNKLKIAREIIYDI